MKTFSNLIYDKTMKIVEDINRELSEKMFPSFDPVIIIIDLYAKTYKHQLKIIEAELKRYRWKCEVREVPEYELYCYREGGAYKTEQRQVSNIKNGMISIELKISIDEVEFVHIFQ